MKKQISKKLYIECENKAVEMDGRFEHVMALALDPSCDYEKGIIRCITSREGDVAKKGYVDRSVLCHVEKNKSGTYEIREKVCIKNEHEIIEKLNMQKLDFIGLEDPDIWIDDKTGMKHIYFTIPLLDKKNNNSIIHLGHAQGKSLDDLEMTMPVLAEKEGFGAKEVSIAPLNKKGFRYNLVESSDHDKGYWYSTVRVAIARDMEGVWEFGETVLHPKEKNIAWIGEHASPGPLLPKSFIDVGEGKCLGFLNGRGVKEKIGSEFKYGAFSVGLFIYDYEEGKIDWVSPDYFIRDSEAKTITFASQFVETAKGEGVLYAHVDDSFVREYKIKADDLRKLLPR